MNAVAVNEFVKNLPVVRALGHETVLYHVGSVWENRLCLQIFRTISKYLLLKVRKRNVTKDIREYVEALERDGVLVIENFLDQGQFEETLLEFESAQKDIRLAPYKGDANAKLYRTQISVPASTEKFPTISKYFQENEMLHNIAAAVVRRKITRRPDVCLDTYQSRNNEGMDNDIENILHADLHTATVKMFYYLNDVNEKNGAFVYAKKSHKLTLQRLRHEYELSVRQAKLKRGLGIQDSLLASRGQEIRNIIHPELSRKMGVAETQMCVPANTLVIANNMGFHRRGEFVCDLPRKAILVNFRYLERPFF